MNIMVLGSGGREHCFAWKLSQSKLCTNLYIAPGNGGTASLGTNLQINPLNFNEIEEAILTYHISMLVVGPEDPLVQGIVDYFRAKPEFDSLIIIGPNKAGALLEGSKDFSKQFMLRNEIPTAQAKTFTSSEYNQAVAYIQNHSYPLVLKADGLAAGKGVLIPKTFDEAKLGLQEILIDKKFNEAGSKVLIESFLEGIELSVFVLTDGKHYKILPEAKDYKRIGEQDTGLNTGGMGAVSPVPFADASFMAKVEDRVIKPTIEGLTKEKIDYRGFLFIGLMNVAGNPYVIEYNVRMGDPETQVVMPRLTSDLVELLEATGKQQLHHFKLEVSDRKAITVVAVSGGYPGAYQKGHPISGLNSSDKDLIVFQAGTMQTADGIVTNGGRVLAVTALATTLLEAKKLAYSTMDKLHWDKMYLRKDIGDDILELL